MDIHYLYSHLREKQQEIVRLKKIHEGQIYKFCSELEKSSLLIHQYKLECDTMRLSLNLKTKNNQDLQTKNTELSAENVKLKNNLLMLISKYRTSYKEIQDARQYILKMIENLD